jgi:MFS family permease
VFFFLTLYLQVVAGFSAFATGAATTPVTVLLLLGSPWSGAAGKRFGPRVPLTAGCLAAGVGALLTLRVGPEAVYWRDVLPAVVVFGLGLTAFVAPLTASVLAAAESRFAGVASGVNNAVARTGSLLAVAALPLVAGLAGSDYADPAALQHGYRGAVVAGACLFFVAAALAAVLLRSPKAEP